MSATELSKVDFGTLYYGCQGEVKSILFNDGPEAASFCASVELHGAAPGGHGWGGGKTGVEDERRGKDKQPVEVSVWCMTRMLQLGSDANGEEMCGGFAYCRVKRLKWGWLMSGKFTENSRTG